MLNYATERHQMDFVNSDLLGPIEQVIVLLR